MNFSYFVIKRIVSLGSFKHPQHTFCYLSCLMKPTDQDPHCFTPRIYRVHTRQGNVREIKKISRSGNCQGILCCVSEKWIFAKMSGKCQGIL